MKYSIIALFLFVCKVAAECPNSCSGHGTCGAHDSCDCYRKWGSNDCSQRVCPFGKSHTDSPKGDLNADGDVTDPDQTVIINSNIWEYGTTEKYPRMKTAGGTVLTNAGHEYFECSNKGSCDRESGVCQCYDGYEGSACQRASCPSNADGVCSGHGTCKSAYALANQYYNNTYNLWDKDVTMGCHCDGGYYGADCSKRQCKKGIDPLFPNDGRFPSFANFTFLFYTTGDSLLTGNYSIWLEDIYGESWRTKPIDIRADCATIIDAIESLPNNAFTNVLCRLWEDTRGYDNTPGIGDYGQTNSKPSQPIYSSSPPRYDYTRFTLVFAGNPGEMSTPRIDIFNDGSRPTLATSAASNNMYYKVYKNGYQGEDRDIVYDRCEGVTVYMAFDGPEQVTMLIPSNGAEIKLLKTCLADSDGDWSNNKEVYNWDFGTPKNPHLIRLANLHQYHNNNYDTNADATYYKQVSYDLDDRSTPISYICDKLYSDPSRFYTINSVGSNDRTKVCAALNPPRIFMTLIYLNYKLTDPLQFHIFAINYILILQDSILLIVSAVMIELKFGLL